MSLKDRLEGKQVRTAVVQVPVGDPPPELRQRAAAEAERSVLAEISAGMGKDSPISADTAQALADTAQSTADELAEFYAPLNLKAAPADVWDRVLTEFADNDGNVDQTRALPVMLSVCCEDEELRDSDWWREQLAGPGWTFGDVEQLYSAVFRLNAWAPMPSLGKGSRTTR